MPLTIRAPTVDELISLSDLCFRSKAAWATKELMEARHGELSFTPRDLQLTAVSVAEHDGKPIGVAQVKIVDDEADLLKLFVEPGALRGGVGTSLILGCGWRRDDCRRSSGHEGTGHRSSAADDIPQAIGARDGRDGSLNSRVDGIEIRHELGGFDRERVRDIEDVLVAHLERAGQEIAGGIAQGDRINHGNDRAFVGLTVDPHRFGDVARFTAIEEHRGGISLDIHQTTGPADRFRERQPPGPKWNLLLRADRAEGQEGLRLPIQVDRIVGMHVDIVGRLINERPKGGDRAPAVSLQ